jgi:hypothetical protein
MKMARRKTVILLVCLLPLFALGGFVFFGNYYSIRSARIITNGMSRTKVESLLGPPTVEFHHAPTEDVVRWQLWDGHATISFDGPSITDIAISEYSLWEMWDRVWNRTTYFLLPPGQPTP